MNSEDELTTKVAEQAEVLIVAQAAKQQPTKEWEPVSQEALTEAKASSSANQEDDERVEVWLPDPKDRAPYYDLCSSLQRNDPQCTIVRGGHEPDDRLIFPFGCGFRIGQALVGNTNVSDFYLQPHRWIKHDIQTIEAVAEYESVPPLLQFLRESKSLRYLDLNFDGTWHDTDSSALHLCNLAMRGAARNSNVTQLTLHHDVQYSLAALAYLIETTTSITILNISIGYESGDELDGSNPLVTAFGLNQTILDLALDYYDCMWNVVVSILKQLESHRCLRRLSLVQGVEVGDWGDEEDDREVAQSSVFAALASLLTCSKLIYSLSLNFYRRIRLEDMEAIQSGILSSKSLRHLEFFDCWFTREATKAFVACMQTPLSSTGRTTSLEKLSVIGSKNGSFHRSTSGEVAALILVTPNVNDTKPNVSCGGVCDEMQPPVIVSTMVSSLQTLQLEWNDFVGFHHAVLATDRPIPLRTLQLRYPKDRDVNPASVRELVQCLPALVYLTELEIVETRVDTVDVEHVRKRLARALCANGSLQRATIRRLVGDDAVSLPLRPLGTADLHTMANGDASYRYQLRNRGIASLLTKASTAADNDTVAAVADSSDRDENGGVESTDNVLNEQILPVYVVDVLAAPRICHKMVLSGLLAAPQDAVVLAPLRCRGAGR